jgi:glycerol uptake facilitator-like aquaporin
VTFSPPPQPESPNRRPQRLATVLILLGILEGLVLVFSLYALGMLVIQLVFGPINTTPSNPAMTQYVEAVFEASLPWAQLPVLWIQALLSATLIYLTVQVFRGVAEEVSRLGSVLLVAVFFTPLKFLFHIYLQSRLYPVLTEHVGAMMPAGGAPPPPGFEETMATVMVFSMVLGIVLNVVVLGGKLFLYGFTRATLRRDDSRSYFGFAPPPGPPADRPDRAG